MMIYHTTVQVEIGEDVSSVLYKQGTWGLHVTKYPIFLESIIMFCVKEF